MKNRMKMKMGRGVIFSLIFFCMVLMNGVIAEAAAITVTTLADEQSDNGNCSLREAIINANNDNQSGSSDCSAGSGADTITFSVFGTVTLGSTLPNITQELTINGTGADKVTLNGSGSNLVMWVETGVTAYIRNLTFSQGRGGIRNNYGTVVVEDCIFSNNIEMGAIYSSGSSAGTVVVARSRFISNTSSQGGAIRSRGTAIISDSLFVGNSVPYHYGGAIFNDRESSMTITNSTFSGNSAGNLGGAVANYVDTSVLISNCTFYGNTAVTGGGIYNWAGAGMTIQNTIVANNPSGGNCYNGGTLTSNGYNISGDSTCNLTDVTDQLNTNPGLGPLADNGGLTQTHALVGGSAAINKIPYGVNGCGTTSTRDQRGIARPQPSGGLCDIGAFEAECVPSPPDMVAWWSGDGHPFDLLGQNNGTMVNGGTYAAGKVGRAFSFDGASAYPGKYVDLPDAASYLINDSAGTITAWVYPTAIGDNDIVVAFGTGYASQGVGIGIFNNVRIYHHTGTYDWQSNTSVSANEWTMLTYTWDSTTEKIYKNGVFSESRPRNFSYFPGHARIGHGFWSDSANAFPGLIDEVAVYSRVLTAQEIASIYDAGDLGACKPCLNTPPGMVSWWTADGNGNDTNGVNDGTMMNGATFAAGKVDQAFSFDGVDDFVQIVSPVTLPVGNAARSMSVWFKTPRNLSTSTESAIVQYGTASDSQVFSLITSANAPGKLYFYGHSNDLAGTTTIQPDTWYHGAVTHDGSTLRLYMNGQLDASSPKTLNTVLDGNGLTIGYRNGSSLWEGLMDEVQIFDRVLSPEEVAFIYAAGSAGVCIPPDTIPEQFTFTDQTDVSLETLIESNDIIVADINVPTSISITGGEYSINGGSYTSVSGTVENNQTVRVRQTSSSSNSTTTNATLTIGGVFDTFSVTTIALPEYTISFSSTGNGTIVCDPATVSMGNNSVCTITPQAGYMLAGLTDNDTDVMDAVSGSTYTINNVTENHTVEAAFERFTFSPENGTLGTMIELSGSGFGTRKGKVYLEKDGVRYATKVSEWNLGGTSNLIKAAVSKTPPAGRYAVLLISKELGELRADKTFEIMAPQLDSVSVNLLEGKPVATIQGDYFGLTKKPKVYMNNGVKDLSCKVTSFNGTEIRCTPHKSVVTGAYTVKVIVGNVLKGERLSDITMP